MVGAGEVHVDDPVPEAIFNGVQRAQIADAGVVDQDREAAERVDGCVDRGTNCVAVAHVDLERRPADLGRNRPRTIAVAVEHRHRRAVARQAQSGRPPDTRCRAGHERDAPLE